MAILSDGVFLALLACAGAAPPAPAATFDDLVKQANTALAAGKGDEALALAGKAIRLDPKNSRGHYFRGILHEALDRHPEAVADFSKVIELDPKTAEAYDRSGSEHFKL